MMDKVIVYDSKSIEINYFIAHISSIKKIGNKYIEITDHWSNKYDKNTLKVVNANSKWDEGFKIKFLTDDIYLKYIICKLIQSLNEIYNINPEGYSNHDYYKDQYQASYILSKTYYSIIKESKLNNESIKLYININMYKYMLDLLFIKYDEKYCNNSKTIFIYIEKIDYTKLKNKYFKDEPKEFMEKIKQSFKHIFKNQFSLDFSLNGSVRDSEEYELE